MCLCTGSLLIIRYHPTPQKCASVLCVQYTVYKPTTTVDQISYTINSTLISSLTVLWIRTDFIGSGSYVQLVPVPDRVSDPI
jgi:hypothetical protein